MIRLTPQSKGETCQTQTVYSVQQAHILVIVLQNGSIKDFVHAQEGWMLLLRGHFIGWWCCTDAFFLTAWVYPVLTHWVWSTSGTTLSSFAFSFMYTCFKPLPRTFFEVIVSEEHSWLCITHVWVTTVHALTFDAELLGLAPQYCPAVLSLRANNVQDNFRRPGLKMWCAILWLWYSHVLKTIFLTFEGCSLSWIRCHQCCIAFHSSFHVLLFAGWASTTRANGPLFLGTGVYDTVGSGAVHMV